MRSSAPLTYRHRAGVRLYTSSCELAESCVFDKQSLEPILCGSGCPEHPLYRGYGVILPSSFTRVLPNAFGCSPSTPVSDCGTGRAVRPRPAFRGRDVIGLPDRAVGLAARGLLTPRSPSSRRHRHVYLHGGWRNINRLSIGYALGPGLRSRLTLGGLTFPRKPCAFGGRASHPSCRYSFRHTHSTALHRSFRSGFAAAVDALLPSLLIRDCGTTLESPSFSARDGSTGKLLRTFEMVAASKPTSRLSRRSHFLRH